MSMLKNVKPTKNTTSINKKVTHKKVQPKNVKKTTTSVSSILKPTQQQLKQKSSKYQSLMLGMEM